MTGRHFVPLFLAALIAAPALGGPPLRLSPVLPEVNKHLEEGQADIQSNTLAMAKAHAQLVLLGSEIKVGVKFQGVPGSMHDRCLKIMDSALAEWEKVLDNDLRFTREPEGEPENVVIRFRPNVLMKNEPVAGYVNWKRTLQTQADGTVTTGFTADLQIRVKNVDGSSMPPAAMRHAVMHEIGHVLGLDDSPHEGDVMGPLDIENPVDGPSALEVQTVRSLRAEAAQIIQAAAATP